MPTDREKLEELRARARYEELKNKANAKPEKKLADGELPPRGYWDLPRNMEELKGDFLGGLEGFLTIGSGMVADVAGGIGGLADAANPFTEEGQGGQTVRDIKKALTYQPRTPDGKALIGDLGDTLRPVVEPLQKYQQAVGDDAFNATGSEALGAIMQTVPAAMLEMLPARRLIRTDLPEVQKYQQKQLPEDNAKGIEELTKEADKALKETAPTTEQLAQAAKDVYQQIDNLGVRIRPEVFQNLAQSLPERLRGFNPELHRDLAQAIEQIGRVSEDLPTSRVDDLRAFIQNAIESANPRESRLGRMLKMEFNDALSAITPNQIVKPRVRVKDGQLEMPNPQVNQMDLGQLYSKADELYRRSNKAEVVDNAFLDAQRKMEISEGSLSYKQAIKQEFANIIKKNRRTKQFSPDEIAAMEKIIEKGTAGEVLSFLGALDFTRPQQANFLFGVSAIGAGAMISGPLGVSVPAIGAVSSRLADKLVRNQAELTRAIVRAGQDGNQIVREYMKAVPKSQRDSLDITELLVNRNIDPRTITSTDPFVKQAVQNARMFTKAELALAFGMPQQAAMLAEQGKQQMNQAQQQEEQADGQIR